MIDKTIDILFLDFAKILMEHSLIKENVKISQIFDACDVLKKREGFKHFVHYWMCDCQIKDTKEND